MPDRSLLPSPEVGLPSSSCSPQLQEGSQFGVVPSSQSLHQFRSSTPLTPVVCDGRVIAKLLETVISKGGLSVNEAARRLGVSDNAIRQYIRGRRHKPSLHWFVRLAEVCGAKVTIEFPRIR